MSDETRKHVEQVSRQVRRQLDRAGLRDISELKPTFVLSGPAGGVMSSAKMPILDGVLAKNNPRCSSEPHGKRNIYTCEECNGHIVTVDLEEGVTPFMLGCKATEGCKGMMQSSMYRVFDQRIRPDFEWYKPKGSEELIRLTAWEREHVAKGGLILRPLTPVPA